MKKSTKHIFSIAWLLIAPWLVVLGVPRAHAEDLYFDEDLSYTVYYEVSEFEVDTVADVKIVGVVTVGNTPFLAVTGMGPGSKDKEGFIALHCVKAVLPDPYIKPRRTFDGK